MGLKFHHNYLYSFHYSLSYWPGHLLVCKSKNLGSWVYQLMIQFIVLSSFSYRITFLSSSCWSFSLLSFLLFFFFFGVCSCPSKISYFLTLRVSEVHLFY